MRTKVPSLVWKQEILTIKVESELPELDYEDPFELFVLFMT